LRADSVRTNIERRYQKISECIAQISGIFSTLFIFLRLIMSYVNNFKANNNIFRNIFKFKNIKDTASYSLIQNIKRKISVKKVKRLERISMMEEFGSFRPGQSVNQLKLIFFEHHSHSSESKNYRSENKCTLNMKDDKKENDLNEKNESNYYFNRNENNIDYKIASNNRSINNSSSISYINNSKSPFGFIFNNLRTGNNKKNYSIKKNELLLNFNFKETFLYLCCFKKSSPVLKTKIKYLEKAQSYFFENLDIQMYFKKMYLIEILNYIIFEPYQNYLLHFLSKPSISISEYNLGFIDYLNKIYKSDYKSDDINEFIKSYNQLIEIKEKTQKDKKLNNIINIEMGYLFG
jgi:hypothetical protein